jgi:hypothetical protein
VHLRRVLAAHGRRRLDGPLPAAGGVGDEESSPCGAGLPGAVDGGAVTAAAGGGERASAADGTVTSTSSREQGAADSDYADGTGRDGGGLAVNLPCNRKIAVPFLLIVINAERGRQSPSGLATCSRACGRFLGSRSTRLQQRGGYVSPRGLRSYAYSKFQEYHVSNKI